MADDEKMRNFIRLLEEATRMAEELNSLINVNGRFLEGKKC